MSKLCIFDTIVILTICYELVTLVVLYYVVTLDIKMFKGAENVNQLHKLTLRYAKKRNFNKDIILRDLIKKIESSRKAIILAKWCLLLEIIFICIFFMPPHSDVIRFGEKIIFKQDSKMMVNDMMILFGITALWVLYFVKLIHQRNIVAHEQFSRLL